MIIYTGNYFYLRIINNITIFDESFKVTSVSFFIPYFNLSENLTFKVLYQSFYIDIILKQNKITILSQFLVKNLK